MQTKKHFKIIGSALAVICSLTLVLSSAVTGFAAEDKQVENPEVSSSQAAVEQALAAVEATEPETQAATEPEAEEITEPVVNSKTEDEELSANPDVPDPRLSNATGGIKLEWAAVNNAKQYYVCGTESGSNVWQRYYTQDCEYTFNNLKSGKLYLFQVQTIAGDGSKSAFSKPRGLTYIAVPTLNTVTNTFETDGSLKLSWSAVSGANQYMIARMRTGDANYEYITTTTNSYTDKNVYDLNTYRYQVRAMYRTQNSGTAYGWWSTSQSAKIAVWPNITLSNSLNGVTVRWDAVKNTARYFVYCKKPSDPNWTRVVTTGLSHTFTGLESGQLYYFQLYSDSISGRDGKFSKTKNIVYIAPPVLSGVTVSNNGKTFTAAWDAVPGATRYQIARKASDAKSYEYIFADGTSYVDVNVPAGKFVSYQVRAIANAADGDVYGYWSNSKVGESFIKPEFSLVSNRSNGIYTEWNKIDNASSYTIYYKEAFESGWSSADIKSNSFAVTDVQPGKLYFLQLRYTGMGGGKSSFSDVKSMTFTQQGTLLSVSSSGTVINLRWAPIDNASYYVLEKYDETTGKKGYITVNGANDYKDTGNVYEHTYYYRVCGVHRETEWHKVYENAAGAYSDKIRINPQAYNMVMTALAQQGQKGYKFCNEMNNGKLDEWCAFFAGWALKQGGFDLKKCGYHGNVGVWCDNLYANDTFEYSEDYVPAMGDVIIFGTSNFRSHIGIVVGVSNGVVTTIEGNAAVPSSYSGEWMANSYVVKKQYDLDNYRIYGYGKMTAK